MSNAPPITLNADASQFETEVDGLRAYLDFIQTGVTFVITHTEVPEGLEGRGIGSALVRTAIDHAGENDLPVMATCPFARAYMQRHSLP